MRLTHAAAPRQPRAGQGDGQGRADVGRQAAGLLRVLKTPYEDCEIKKEQKEQSPIDVHFRSARGLDAVSPSFVIKRAKCGLVGTRATRFSQPYRSRS